MIFAATESEGMIMAEYIERKKLSEKIDWDNDIEKWTIYDDDLRSIPPADVEPVKHGKWRWSGEDKWNDCYECSSCGKICLDNSKYCPNCGAKMDEEDRV